MDLSNLSTCQVVQRGSAALPTERREGPGSWDSKDLNQILQMPLVADPGKF